MATEPVATMGNWMPSGDPRKQERPADAAPAPDAADQMTNAFPPALSGVMTSMGAEVVPFPGFVGGKAIDVAISFGPLTVHGHVHPDVIEQIIEELRQAKMKADTGLAPASMGDIARVASGVKANGNGG